MARPSPDNPGSANRTCAESACSPVLDLNRSPHLTAPLEPLCTFGITGGLRCLLRLAHDERVQHFAQSACERRASAHAAGRTRLTRRIELPRQSADDRAKTCSRPSSSAAVEKPLNRV